VADPDLSQALLEMLVGATAEAAKALPAALVTAGAVQQRRQQQQHKKKKKK
jgi:hypothetical protein